MSELAGIDAMMPDNADEFKEFGDALFNKINQFNKHADYPTFAEELIKNISLTCKLKKHYFILLIVIFFSSKYYSNGNAYFSM